MKKTYFRLWPRIVIVLSPFVGTVFNRAECLAQIWVARYNGTGNWDDEAYAIAVDGVGNVYVTGYSYGSGSDWDYATVKYDSAGVEQWVATYNGPGNGKDVAHAIAVDASGNVYVTGESWGSGTYDYATVKYNSAGDSVWVRRYNGPANSGDIAYAIALDGVGNVYVTGYSYGSGTSFDYATVKYNSSGVEQWVERYNGPGNGTDVAYAIAVDGSINVYVTGSSKGSGTYEDYATVKYNSSGDSVWVRRYNGPGNYYDYANAIALDGSGDVYVTGRSVGSGTGYDYATVKYDSTGDSVWVRRYNGPGNDEDWASAIALDGNGNIYVTGRSEGSGTYWDYATVKYDSSGDSVWLERYNGPGYYSDYAYAIALDGVGNVYVTGGSVGSGFDYATIKYLGAGVEEPNPQPLNPKPQLEVYPNPFISTIEIEYGLPKSTDVNITIYSLSGQKVITLVDENKKPSYYKISWNGYDRLRNRVTPGIYFCKLETAEFKATTKLTILR